MLLFVATMGGVLALAVLSCLALKLVHTFSGEPYSHHDGMHGEHVSRVALKHYVVGPHIY